MPHPDSEDPGAKRLTEPYELSARRGSVGGIVRLIVGILIALPAGFCTVMIVPKTHTGWGSHDYGLLVALIILPLISGIALAGAGWRMLKNGPNVGTTIATIASLLLIAFSLVTCNSERFTN